MLQVFSTAEVTPGLVAGTTSTAATWAPPQCPPTVTTPTTMTTTSARSTTLTIQSEFHFILLLEKGLRAHSSFKSTSSSVAILRRCSCDQSSMFFCSVCNFQTNVLFKVQRKFQVFEISLLEFGCIYHIRTTHTSYRQHLHYL